MKKYVEKVDKWRVLKALSYLGNFFKNHKGSVNDNDLFIPVSDYMEECDWEGEIRKTFSQSAIKRMADENRRRYSLDFNDRPAEMLYCIWNAPFARKKLAEWLCAKIRENLQASPLEKFCNETFPVRLAELQKTFALTDFDIEVLCVLAFVRNDMLTIVDGHNRQTDENDKAVFVAKCLDCDVSNVLAALDCKGKLRRYGCIDNEFDFNRRLFEFLNGISCEPLSSRYFKVCQEECLPWDFYGNLAEKHGELIKSILRDSRSAGNILLYGAPGTGKTSFAKTIAGQLGRKCCIISQDTKMSDQSTSSPEHRFAALQVCDIQVDPAESLIIVDEADDMLSCGGSFGGFPFLFSRMGSSKGDKGMLNDVLDHIRTPTIWITNTPADELDESSRRRFDYSVRFDPLNAVQRKSIWMNNIRKMGLETLIDEQLADCFAGRYDVNAGIITKILGNVKKLSPEKSGVRLLMEKLMAQHCELLNIKVADSKLAPAKDYSLEGLNIRGDLELEKIISACRKFQQDDGISPDRPRMNLLLSGPPGTGKTEFVKYLGQTLDTKIHVRMGSDLLSMYVGGTEQNIREAFDRAEAERAILFLDEIDGLLQSRDRAVRSWEITQVNELLHRMENFNGILIGATNFSANLDPATLRRFTFKIGFDYLDNEGKKLFFERMFQSRLSAQENRILAGIQRLAPGDFRTVRQSLYYLADDVTNADRLRALAAESEARQGNKSSRDEKIGF